jgi:hypothetical protein
VAVVVEVVGVMVTRAAEAAVLQVGRAHLQEDLTVLLLLAEPAAPEEEVQQEPHREPGLMETRLEGVEEATQQQTITWGNRVVMGGSLF